MPGNDPTSENQPNPTLVSVTSGNGYIIVDFTTDPYSSNVRYSYFSIWDTTNDQSLRNIALTEAEINDGLYKISGLNVGETYALQLVQRNSSGEYYYSNVLIAQTITPPNAPIILTENSEYPIMVNYVNEDKYRLSFHLSFDRTNATGILFLLFSKTKNTTQHIPLSFSGTGLIQQYIVEELVQDDYLCSCRGIYPDIEGLTSNIFTLEVGLLPNPPTIKQVISGRNKELVVNFETIQNIAYNVQSVTVEYSIDDEWSPNNRVTLPFSPSTTNPLTGSVTIPNLENGTTYQVRAYATNENGLSGNSNVLTGIPAKKPVISVVHVTKASKNGTVHADWVVDLGNFDSDVKYLYTVKQNQIEIASGTTVDTFIEINGLTGLAIDDLIFVNVTAYTSVPDFMSWLSPDLAVLSDEPGKKWLTSAALQNLNGLGVTEQPTMSSVISGNDRSLEASFSIKVNTANPITSVVVQYTEVSDQDWVNINEIEMLASTFTTLVGYHSKTITIPNLDNGSTYKLRAYAKNTNGVNSGNSNELTGIPAKKPVISVVHVTKASKNGTVHADWVVDLGNFDTDVKYLYTVKKSQHVISSGTTVDTFIEINGLTNLEINDLIYVNVTAYTSVPDFMSWLSPDLEVLSDEPGKKWLTSAALQNSDGLGVTEEPTMNDVISGNDRSLEASFSIKVNYSNPITSVVLQYTEVTDQDWLNINEIEMLASTFTTLVGYHSKTITIPNLDNGSTYKLRVYAKNTNGVNSGNSNVLTGIPAKKPVISVVHVTKASKNGNIQADWEVDLGTFDTDVKYLYTVKKNQQVISSGTTVDKYISIEGLTNLLINDLIYVNVTAYTSVPDFMRWLSPDLAVLSDEPGKKWLTSAALQNSNGLGVTEQPTMNIVMSGNDRSLEASFSIKVNTANPITSVVLQYTKFSVEEWITFRDIPYTEFTTSSGKYYKTVNITDLDNKQVYRVRAYAKNTNGVSSDNSNVITGIPAIKPSVTNVNVTKATQSGIFEANWSANLGTYSDSPTLYYYVIFNGDMTSVLYSGTLANTNIALSGLTLPTQIVFIVTAYVTVDEADYWYAPDLSVLTFNSMPYDNMLGSDPNSSTIDITLNPLIPTSVTHEVFSTSELKFTVNTQNIVNKMRPMSAKIELFADAQLQELLGTFTNSYGEASSSTIISVPSLITSKRYYIKVYNYNESRISEAFLPGKAYWTFNRPKDITNVTLTQGINELVSDHTIAWSAYSGDVDYEVDNYVVKLYKVENNGDKLETFSQVVGKDQTSYTYTHPDTNKGLTFVAGVFANLTNLQNSDAAYTNITYSENDLLATPPTIYDITLVGTTISFKVDANGSPLISLLSVVFPSASNRLPVPTPVQNYSLSTTDDIHTYTANTGYNISSDSGYLIVAVNSVGSSYLTENMS